MKTNLVLALVGALLASGALVFVGRTRKVGIAMLAVGLTSIGWFVVRDITLSREYDKATLGGRRETITHRIGSPDRTTPARTDFWGHIGEAEPCAMTDWYVATFTIDMYSFCYSSDLRLLSKYNWSSY